MADRILPTLSELLTLAPAPGYRLLAALDIPMLATVGAEHHDALLDDPRPGVPAERAIWALWDAARLVGPVGLIATVPHINPEHAYVFAGEWTGITPGSPGNFIVESEIRGKHSLSIPLVSAMAVYVPENPLVSPTGTLVR